MNITDLNSPVPGCDVYELMGGRLHQPFPLAQAVLIFIIIINILTFPFTVVLNALVMVAVKVKYRLRSQKVEYFDRPAGLNRFRGRGHHSARIHCVGNSGLT